MNPGESLPAGHMLDGRYRIHKVLGVGGMGRVYMANDTRLANRPVACKEMIVGDGVAEKKAIEDFAREARVLALLSHPGIPSLIDYFVEGGRHYLVMEFVAGGDIQAMLDKLGPGAKFPESQVLKWARQMLEVLDFLHRQDPPIVYRDLKPGNIMIDKDGRAMLIDFGIARFLPPGGRGTQIGSVGYAPPEQYMGKTEPRSDLYSLAATMHHLLTGRDPQLEPPFSFPSLRDLNPAVSKQTAAVVMRALDKDLEKRPRNAREMLSALPPPGPDNGYSGYGSVAEHAQPSRSGAPMAVMKTLVLSQPAPAQPGASQSTPAQPHQLPPRFLPASSSASSSGSSVAASGARPASSMQTIVLSNPVGSASGPATSRKSIDLSKAADMKDRALAMLGRGIKVGLKVITPVVNERVINTRFETPSNTSSTAKTADLAKSRPVTPIRHVVATPTNSSPATPSKPSPATAVKPSAATSSRPVGSTVSRGASVSSMPASPAPPAKPTAHLVAKAEGVEFGITGTRALIGRSVNRQQTVQQNLPNVPNVKDSLDIDLAPLRQSADRVSRRHAEIVKRGGDFFIRDLGSLNGTFIVGRGKLGRDQLYQLKDGDQVMLGNAILEFRKV